jgi:cytochrome c-type biogenesis protein CcmH
MKSLRIVLFSLLCLQAMPAGAGTEMFDFSGNVDEQRYMALISQLRCLVCQNQSLADSDADLAHDLRVEVYEHLQQGENDQQVVDFLVSRYGDFVLYNPPVKPSTYLLWYGPFVLLALGLLLLVKNIRRRGRQSQESFSPEEQARIDALLADENRQERGQ